MIRFSKYIFLYFLLSSFVLVPGIIALLRWGLRPSIDFTGGTLMELRFDKAIDAKKIIDVAAATSLTLSSVAPSGDKTYLIRLKPTADERLKFFETQLASSSASSPQIIRQETVGPTLGAELLVKAVVAAFVAIGAILLYIAYAFKNIRFGVAAIVALIHDLLVVLGSFSLLGHFYGVEVDTLFVTAFLTTMSFSVHDTIVVFDRIREYSKRAERVSFDALCDQALTETMGRSLTNSLTLILMLLALVLMGGETIRWFIVALLVGTTSGAYSSPFIATPILILWDRFEKRKRKTI
ncbi:protein translocase subunit SecF [Candidatus Gottesmanbacteria bacterium]|nr:protein translocase subunit SecF [Candidatus Gottesmanbacteria bacterium]